MMSNPTAHEHLSFHWQPSRIAQSYALGLLGAFTTVLLMEERRRSKHRVRQRLLMLASSVSLGGVAVWSMHQVGMAAMTLDSPTTGHVYTPTYDVRGMLGSLLLSLVSVHVGLSIAQRDKYFGASKQQRIALLSHDLKAMMRAGRASGAVDRQSGIKMVEMKALSADLGRIVSGALVSGIGVVAVHYLGLVSMLLPGAGHIVACATTSVFAFIISYWVVFRVLQWRQREEALRLVSAALVSVLICTMHYIGMSGISYVTDDHHIAVPSSLQMPSRGVSQLVIVIVAVALCMAGVYTSLYNVRREMSALKDEIDDLSRAFTAMTAFSSAASSTTSAYQSKLEAFLLRCASFLQRYTRNSQDLAFDNVAQRLLYVRKNRRGGGSNGNLSRASSTGTQYSFNHHAVTRALWSTKVAITASPVTDSDALGVNSPRTPRVRSPSSALLMGRRTPGADASTCSPEAQRRVNDQGHSAITSPCTALSPRRLLSGLTSPRIINKADAAATTASATHHDNHAREGAGGMAHGIPSTIKEEEDGDQEDDSGGEKSAQAAEQKSQGDGGANPYSGALAMVLMSQDASAAAARPTSNGEASVVSDFMHTGVLDRKSSGDQYKPSPVEFKVAMPDQLYGSYASWGDGQHHGHGSGSESHADGRGPRSSSSQGTDHLGHIGSESEGEWGQVSDCSDMGAEGAVAGAGGGSTGFLLHQHLPLTVIPEDEESGRTGRMMSGMSLGGNLLTEEEDDDEGLAGEWGVRREDGEEDEEDEGELVIRVRRGREGGLQVVSAVVRDGMEKVVEAVSIADDVAGGGAESLGRAMLATLGLDGGLQDGARAKERAAVRGGGLERRESWSPSSSRSASSRGSDVEMRGVIEGHVKDWEGQQLFGSLLNGLLPQPLYPSPVTSTSIVEDVASGRQVSSPVTAAGEALQKPLEEEKARSPTAKPRPPMLQRSWSSEAGQERRASLTNSGGQLATPGEVKKSSSMGHAVVTALLRQLSRKSSNRSLMSSPSSKSQRALSLSRESNLLAEEEQAAMGHGGVDEGLAEP